MTSNTTHLKSLASHAAVQYGLHEITKKMPSDTRIFLHISALLVSWLLLKETEIKSS